MKLQLLIFTIGLLNVIPTDGRLIQKNKTRNIEEAQTEKPNPTIRLTRDIENDSLTGFSKEESVQSEEFTRSYNKKARFLFKLRVPKTQTQKKTRVVRDSMENIKPDTKNKQAKEPKKPTKPKAVLVKKPIPKYNDKDYDDFQSMISNSHIIADSDDYEDEDFNLEDYDFDINHDEFTSGRKHLEPRIMRIKSTELDGTDKPSMKIAGKVVVPNNTKAVSNKKERAAELNSKKTTDKIKEVDYYDDTTTTKAPEINTKAQEDEYSDESYDSKELDHKNSSRRTVRSWNINLLGNKFNDKMSRVVEKFLSVLPLFPEVPNAYQIDAEDPDSSEVITDTLTGRHWILNF